MPTQEPSETPHLPEAEPRANWRRRLRIPLVVIAVLATIAAGLYAWTYVVDDAAGQVEILAGPPECTGTQVTTVRDDSWDNPVAGLPAPALRASMDCRSPLTLVNESSRSVHLKSLELGLRGPSGGPAVAVQEVLVGEVALSPIHDSDSIDHRVRLDRSLAGGESLDLVVRHRFRSDGCTTRGHFWTPAGSVRFTLLGQTKDVVSSDLTVWRGTRESSCDD